MSQDFLSYWKPETADNNIKIDNGILEHSASNQYGRVEVGDTIWIVTVRNGYLFLLGNILVSKLVTQEEASRIFKSEILWEARYHVLSERHSAQSIMDVPIAHLAEHLRFRSVSGRNRLDLLDGKVNPQQLQTMRALEPASAKLMNSALSNPPTQRMKKPLSSPSKTKPPAGPRKAASSKTKSDNVIIALKKLQTAARNNYDNLIKRDYTGVDRSEIDLNGLCYVLAECMYHLFPYLLPHRIGWEDGSSHWFLRYPDGQILEAIAENGVCSNPDNYTEARRRGFLTSWPSKRALQLYELAGIKNPANA